ncbi:hypothetical protein H0486_08170 [Lachnospiraceae bacterium MD1]|uniref:Pyruvate carboxyltransferase domain-containing protein n=1 Tax=Variimorphobacter saccharofermentans TaxID=2755051 RepID=A0A839K1L1_9FIRM|nr:hypothetical protein [Variimorphobacter saccharofermentans]MBB2182849.1 hypothetical protein [Variimorphobacter saccharofermentans]
MNRIKILDCTLRDGGFALEDADKNGAETKTFQRGDRDKIANYIVESNVEIVELGAIEVSDCDKKGFAIYQNMEEISSIIPHKRRNNQLFAGFYRGPDIDTSSIPSWDESKLDITRICLRYSELKKSLEFSKDLSKKGYKVFLQPMVTVRYSDAELQMVLNAANEMDAYAVYFVDSYGYMTPEDVIKYFTWFNETLKPSIHIGFHAHNNMEMALLNVITLLNIDTDRKIIIDSCATGMGQGTGNLQSEVILNYMNANYNCNYNVDKMYQACEIVDEFNINRLWGYSIPRYIAANNKTAYKYAIELQDKYQMSYSEIDQILSNIPDDLRFRYTVENTKELLRRLGKL